MPKLGYAEKTMSETFTPTLDARAIRSRRRARVQTPAHVVTADEHSMLDAQLFLATLPMCARGRVFVEVATPEQIGQLDAPSRMTVTWLVRERRGATRAKGELVSRAALAWLSEMGEDEAGKPNAVLLGGYLGTAEIAEQLVARFGYDRTDIQAPTAFGHLL